MNLENFSPESRVWIYLADRFLTETEKIWLQKQIEIFTENWASHGNQLKATGLIYNDFTVVLAVDTSVANSSGCSIDKSVHFIKEVGKELNVDFFNRLKVWIEENDNFSRISFKDLSNYPNAIYFDATIQNLIDFKSNYGKKSTKILIK